MCKLQGSYYSEQNDDHVLYCDAVGDAHSGHTRFRRWSEKIVWQLSRTHPILQVFVRVAALDQLINISQFLREALKCSINLHVTVIWFMNNQ